MPSTQYQVQLFNTLSRAVEKLQPLQAGVVSVYTCGPTVYNDQHIGNYRTFVFEDVLVKTLRAANFQVKRVMNITDVGHLTSDADEGEDKLEVGAKREGITAWDVAARYTEHFLADLAQLAIEVPEPLVRATTTIPTQIKLVQLLEEKGYTYRTADGIYFDTAKLADYGTLARLDIAGLQAGTRVAVGEKRRATDFALWKFSPAGQQRDMEWESPWGVGFPGWHLECSAIIWETLGETIDMHCGGVDHIPVHHINEIAQSEAAFGKPLASLWLHGEFLLVDGGKMSKSLGNVYTLADIAAKGIDPLALRMLFYSASYRSKLNFTWEGLEQAARSLRSLRRVYQEGEPGGTAPQTALDAFYQALFTDLNMPEALAVVWEVARGGESAATKRAFLEEVDTILSLRLNQPEVVVIPDGVQKLFEERETARTNKNWAEADRLRNEITKAGFQVQDSPEGSKLIAE